MTQLTKAEALKSEKLEKERELQQLIETAGASGHQKLRVCDICGAYLSVLDSDRRLADHFGGKVRTCGSSRFASTWLTGDDLPTRCTWATTNCASSWTNGTGAVRCRRRLSPP